jgi:ketosteroid isomerase-like protein
MSYSHSAARPIETASLVSFLYPVAEDRMAEEGEVMIAALSQRASEGDIHQALADWVDAVNGGSASAINALYAEDALLLATFDPVPVTDAKGRIAYFTNLAAREELKVTVQESRFRHYGRVGTASGLYTFSYRENGQRVEVLSRFSFVFMKGATGEWKIADHHSSIAMIPAAR